MKSYLTIALLFFSILMQAQLPKNASRKGTKVVAKGSLLKGSTSSDILKNKKTMTAEELGKLGIELPGTWFTIVGNINGLKDSTQVFITNVSDGKSFAQDRAVKGMFKLRGQLEHEGLYAISFAGYKDRLTLFMANDSVSVSGSTDHMEALTIKGSEMVDDFETYRHGYDAEAGKLSELLQRINAESKGAKRDSLIGDYKKIVVVNADLFLKQKPASPTSCFVLYTIAGLLDSVAELSNRFDKILPKAKRGMYAELINRKINETKINVIGTYAQDFTQNTPAGKPISLHALRGQYVLIHFWASWCKQCKDEIPGLLSLYQQYKNRKFTIVGVSLDTEKDSWIKAVKDDKMDWLQVSDLKFWDNEVARLYKIESIPQNILIDADGKIIGKNLSPDELQTKFALLCK